MSKRKLILLIVILVVVNISTYCGYGKMRRANRNKEQIVLNEVDSLKILRLPRAGDTLPYHWKKLTELQKTDFVKRWNWMDAAFRQKFKPEYKLWVYFKDKTIRKFNIYKGIVKEKRFYYRSAATGEDYFEKVYLNAN